MHRVLAGGWNGPEGGLRKDSPDSSGGSCSATEFAECLVADSAEPCYGACRFPVLLQIGLLLNFRPVFGSWRSVFRFRFRGSCNRRPLVEFGRGLRGVFRASGRGRSRFITGMLSFVECLCQVCCWFPLTPHPQLSSSLRRLSACVQGLSPPVSASWAGLAGPLVRDCTRFVSYIL